MVETYTEVFEKGTVVLDMSSCYNDKAGAGSGAFGESHSCISKARRIGPF